MRYFHTSGSAFVPHFNVRATPCRASRAAVIHLFSPIARSASIIPRPALPSTRRVTVQASHSSAKAGDNDGSFPSDLRRSNSAAPNGDNANSNAAASAAAAAIARAPAPPKRKVAFAGLIFLIITYLWGIILIIPMLVAHPFVLLFDRVSRRFHDGVAMLWMRCSLWSVGVRPRVIDAHNIPPPGTPVVFIANHTSYLDIFMFAYLFRRLKYVSKSEIFNIPVMGWAMRMANNIELVRSSSRGQMDAYRKMIFTLRNGTSIVVFPEGTRSPTGIMRRFKPGAFRAAKQNQALVVPVTILGTREVMPSYAYVPLRYPTSPITLIVHKPIASAGLTVSELCDAAFEAVNSALPALTQSSLKHGQDETKGSSAL